MTKRGRFSTEAAVLFLAFALGVRSVDGAQEPPSSEAPIAELQRLVHCGAGWKLTVYESGEAHQKVEDTCGEPSSYSRTHRLSAEDIAGLRDAIRETRFAELPDEIRADTIYPDEDAFVITIATGEGKTRVLARGVERDESAEARRFRMVWDAVMRRVPDPRVPNGRR